MNRITISGNSAKDAELSKTKTGNDMARIRVAVARNGQKDKTDWFDCCCFGKLATDVVGKFVKKGTRVLLSGKLEFYELGTEDKKEIRPILSFDDFELISQPNETKKEEPVDDDDSPF